MDQLYTAVQFPRSVAVAASFTSKRVDLANSKRDQFPLARQQADEFEEVDDNLFRKAFTLASNS